MNQDVARQASDAIVAVVSSIRGDTALSSGSTVVPVQDPGHLIQLEQPGLVMKEVERLLARAAEPVDGGSGSMGR